MIAPVEEIRVRENGQSRITDNDSCRSYKNDGTRVPALGILLLVSFGIFFAPRVVPLLRKQATLEYICFPRFPWLHSLLLQVSS